MMPLVRLFVVAILLAPLAAQAQPGPAEHWVASWTGSAQGPYPSGFPSAQPVLSFAFPTAASSPTE